MGDTHLFKHEGVLYAVTGHILRSYETEHLKEKLSLLRDHSRLYTLHRLHVVPAEYRQYT